jgi:hypothetical protein
MSSIITQTCNGYTVTLQIDVLSVRPASDPVETVPPAASPAISNEPATMPVMPSFLPGEKGGEKESEKKVAQRKEKEKDPERESLARQLSRIAEAWNLLPLKKVTRFTGRRKERAELLLAQYTEEEIIRAIYSIARSPFLLGGGANHWQIRFDWFILPDNFRKVLEGNYLDDEADGDPEPSSNGRLGFESRDLEAINQVWTDSSDSLRGGAV